ncbi:MAG TPA: alginate lyase family protein [Candidatus Tectomicrobia bacterium]
MIALLLLVIETLDGLAQNSQGGLWISPAELAQLKMEGMHWKRLKSQAQAPAGSPNLSDQDQKNNVYVLAKALVYARCRLESAHVQCIDIPLESLHDEVVSQVMSAMGTETGGRTLALGRKLAAYVIAADLVGLPPDKDQIFQSWLHDVRRKILAGEKTLIATHEERPNNWGTMAGASRAAVAVYLKDTIDLERTARVFKGWLGDRSTYAGFKYGELSWQCDPSKPVGINPKGCIRAGHSIDGVLSDDQRRSGTFTWPPPHENYVYEALQGAIVQAVILHRAGYDPFNWADKALLRAYQWLRTEANFSAKGDDTWQLPLVDCFYDTHLWDGGLTSTGKNIGWTGWTHAQRGGCVRDRAGAAITVPTPQDLRITSPREQ